MCAVLSGNRNFEGRIHPDVRMNYLASPPLVVAYALVGTMDIELTTEPLGTTAAGEPVSCSPTCGRRPQRSTPWSIKYSAATNSLRVVRHSLRRRRAVGRPRGR